MPSFAFPGRRFFSAAILVYEGHSRRDGLATVPDSPDCGLVIDEKPFAKEAKVFHDLKS